MTKQTSKILALLVVSGLVAGLAGCKCGCDENRKAGLAIIECQPVDLTITDATQPAKFSVIATGPILYYQWYRYDHALTEGDEKTNHVEGIYSSELSIEGAWKTNSAAFHCEIGSTNSAGDELRTSTRIAYLIFAPERRVEMMLLSTPVVNLPPPGKPQTCSNFTYCSVAPPFRGIQSPAINPPPKNCEVTLMMIDPPTQPKAAAVPPSSYYLKVLDGENNAVWVGQNYSSGSGPKSFALTKPPYLMTVYYTCNGPTDTPRIYLDLNWKP